MFGNGDTAPKNLRNAFGVMKASIKEVRKKLRRQRTEVAPRQFCKICAATFDEATVEKDFKPQASICVPCRGLLATGYTALVTMNPDRYAFIRHAGLKEGGLAGKIVQLTKENFDKWENKYKEKKADEKPQTETDTPEQAG